MSDLPHVWTAAVDVKPGELKAGDLVVVDAGFTCISPWTILRVREQQRQGKGKKNRLVIPCCHGDHGLDGQENGPGKPYSGVRKIVALNEEIGPR